MNLIKKIFLLGLTSFLMTGCSLTKDNLEDATIYTTVYPIEYLTEFLYSDYATIESIYPNGADVTTYELTEKQLKEYADSDLFIYNGLGNEKNIAKDMININDNLLIIDVANGLNYTYGIEELWMSPNNCLMLAKNIKDYLIEYLESTTIIDYVKAKYAELSEILSLKDADLRAIGKEARENGTNTLIVSNDVFKFLENYGFEIISLDENTLTWDKVKHADVYTITLQKEGYIKKTEIQTTKNEINLEQLSDGIYKIFVVFAAYMAVNRKSTHMRICKVGVYGAGRNAAEIHIKIFGKCRAITAVWGIYGGQSASSSSASI